MAFEKERLLCTSFIVMARPIGCNLYNKHVTTFRMIYPNIPEILNTQYGITLTEKIQIRQVSRFQEVPIRMRKGKLAGRRLRSYRTPVKHYFIGTLEELQKKIDDMYEKRVWSKRRRQNKTLEVQACG